MSWYKITFPLMTTEDDPNVVEIGKIAWDVYQKENEPEGFGLIHATRGSFDGMNDLRLVYLSPVAAELCKEVAEKYTLEPCDVPSRYEPDVHWVFGDPLVKNQLKDTFEPEPGTVEEARLQAQLTEIAAGQAEYERLQALAQAEAEAAVQVEAEAAESAKSAS